jgi:hypothetical protein
MGFVSTVMIYILIFDLYCLLVKQEWPNFRGHWCLNIYLKFQYIVISLQTLVIAYAQMYGKTSIFHIYGTQFNYRPEHWLSGSGFCDYFGPSMWIPSYFLKLEHYKCLLNIFFFFWRYNQFCLCILRSSSGAIASLRTRFLDHTQRRATVGTPPLDGWSVRRIDLYLTTHNTHNRQTSMPSVGFEPTISAVEWPKTYVLDRAATGTGYILYISLKFLH